MSKQATLTGEAVKSPEVLVTFKLNGSAVPAREFPERRYDTGGAIPLAPDLARKAMNFMKDIFAENAKRLESAQA